MQSGSFFSAYQAVRAGGPGLTVSVTHSNGAFADLVTTAGAADSRTVTLVPGAFNSADDGSDGRGAFDPVSAGSTTVSATATGFTLIRTEAVTVTAPGVSLFGFPTNVGSGLQYGTFTARLGATLHGGVTMRIQSSNPAMLAGHAVVRGPFIDVDGAERLDRCELLRARDGRGDRRADHHRHGHRLSPRHPPPSTCSRRGWNWCRCRIRPPRSRPTRRSTCGPESCNRGASSRPTRLWGGGTTGGRRSTSRIAMVRSRTW